MKQTSEEIALWVLRNRYSPKSQLVIEEYIITSINELLKTSKEDRITIIYESGKYFGYPHCCISEYINDVIDKKYERIDHRLDIATHNKKGALNGFVPCTKHSIEISTGLITLNDIIKNRICPEPIEPIKT